MGWRKGEGRREGRRLKEGREGRWMGEYIGRCSDKGVEEGRGKEIEEREEREGGREGGREIEWREGGTTFPSSFLAQSLTSIHLPLCFHLPPCPPPTPLQCHPPPFAPLCSHQICSLQYSNTGDSILVASGSAQVIGPSSKYTATVHSLDVCIDEEFKRIRSLSTIS